MPKEIADAINASALSSSAPDATIAPAGTPDDNTPPTSSGTGEPVSTTPTEPASMADAIDAALNALGDAEKSDPAGPAAPAPEDTPDADGAKPAETPDGDKAGGTGDGDTSEAETGTEPEELPDPTEDEMKAFRPNVQRRIKQLLNQRSAARTEAETLRPDAGRYQAIRSFMSENDLADAEVADLFKAGADLKSGDPARLQAFLSRVQPLVQFALEATGQAIPQDLRGTVDSGEMTETAAQELAAARHRAAAAEARTQRTQAQVQQMHTGANRAQIAAAVQQWTTQAQATDPDFARKTDVMRRVAQGIVAERGLPQTAEQAIQFSKDAYEEATRLLRAAQPPRQATAPKPTATTSAPRNGVQTAPTSLADVIDRALGG